MVTEAKDIIDQLDDLEFEEVTTKSFNSCLIPKEYLPVYQAIEKKNMDANSLSRALKLPVSEINSILFMLELENNIEMLPGGEYRIKRE